MFISRAFVPTLYLHYTNTFLVYIASIIHSIECNLRIYFLKNNWVRFCIYLSGFGTEHRNCDKSYDLINALSTTTHFFTKLLLYVHDETNVWHRQKNKKLSKSVIITHTHKCPTMMTTAHFKSSSLMCHANAKT